MDTSQHLVQSKFFEDFCAHALLASAHNKLQIKGRMCDVQQLKAVGTNADDE